jgi:hypothetical protein
VSRRSSFEPSGSGFRELLERRGWVKVPWRLVSSRAVPDVSVSVYVKVAALALRAEGCTAGVARLAAYLRLSKSSVERGLRVLSVPDPVDGVVELSRRRRTKPGGVGTTALRRPRPVPRGERFVWVPVALVEVLEPRQVRAWAALAYAEATGWLVTEAELGEILVHHSGRRAGKPVGPEARSSSRWKLSVSCWSGAGRDIRGATSTWCWTGRWGATRRLARVGRIRRGVPGLVRDRVRCLVRDPSRIRKTARLTDVMRAQVGLFNPP